MKISKTTERERAIVGVTASLRSYIDSGLFVERGQADRAREVLASGDEDQIVGLMRTSLLSASESASAAATNPRRVQGIYGVYQDARYRLLVLDHIDWRPNDAVWKEVSTVSDDMLQQMHADGGYRAIHADHAKQLNWQDFLDSVFQERFFAVRHALLGPAYEGPRSEQKLPINIDGEMCTFEVIPRLVGHGKNVAALVYQVRKGEGQQSANGVSDQKLVVIEDRMTVPTYDMVAFIKGYARDAFAPPKLVNVTEQGIDSLGLHEAIPDEDGTYGKGYRDALESIALALQGQGVSASVINEAVEVAVEAYGNNAPEDDDVNDAPRPC